MDRPWVVIVGGACGLLLVGLAVKHCGSPNSDGLAEGTPAHVEKLARRSGSDRAGWIAHPDMGEMGHPADTATAGSPRRTSAQGTHSQGAPRVDTSGSAPEAGGAAVVTSGARARNYIGVGSAAGSDVSDSGTVQVGGKVPLPSGAPFQGALTGSPESQGEREQRMLRNFLNQPGDPGAPKDPQSSEDGVLLEMSFDKTTQADRGDATPMIEEGVTLDEGGARFDTNAKFAIPNAGNIKGEAGTISFSVTPDWSGSDSNLASLLQLRGDTWENRLQIFKDGPYMRFLFTPDSGIESGGGTNISNWQPGDQHQITATWGVTDSGERLASLYIDWRLAAQQPYQGQLMVQPNLPLYIGSDYQGGAPGAGGSISSLKILDHASAP